ncbi:E3 ubiquitin-protein ligase RNF168 [Solea senegalensis]|uniref:RING-type E3 ubiquitin transferase n=1 Tax=Solea senegalensis TaxID=28829 RepID=A0AAV6PZ89_SOLSE|nr:E3 ubiquitin-protein ligase RNF168 [Solea senegalensis]
MVLKLVCPSGWSSLQRRRMSKSRKRMSQVSNVEVDMSDEGARREDPPSLDECRCTVCLEIFLEPVTLPCRHTFCKSCFLESVDKAALSCPLCRLRVSTWARVNSKKNTLVNDQLWKQIQTHFPQHCERRRSGRGDEDDLGVSCVPTLSRPGEVQREYQDQVTKNATPESLRPANIAAASRKKEVLCGRIEKFFPRPSKLFSDSSPTSTLTSNKENIISDLDHHEPTTNRTEVPHRSHLTAPTPPTKRKVSELEVMDEDKEAMAKRGCHTSSCLVGAVLSPQLEAEWDSELMSRQQQEEEDLRLALLLQKELDREEKRRVSDRSKGSADAYLLRTSKGKRVDPGSKTPKTPSGRTSKRSSSTSSSSSSSRTCSKQTTLTEMFSSR